MNFLSPQLDLLNIGMDANNYGQEDTAILLWSQVRYFPLPEAAWFEICEGRLELLPTAVEFEPRYTMSQPEEGPEAQRHRMEFDQIVRICRDNWLNVPCLRIEVDDEAYRYGWTSRREDVKGVFNVEEWLRALRYRLGKGRFF